MMDEETNRKEQGRKQAKRRTRYLYTAESRHFEIRRRHSTANDRSMTGSHGGPAPKSQKHEYIPQNNT